MLVLDDIDVVEMICDTVEVEPLCSTILHPCQGIQVERRGSGDAENGGCSGADVGPGCVRNSRNCDIAAVDGYRADDCPRPAPDWPSALGLGMTPLSPIYPMSLPNSLIMALPIRHTHPNPSPVAH